MWRFCLEKKVREYIHALRTRPARYRKNEEVLVQLCSKPEVTHFPLKGKSGFLVSFLHTIRFPSIPSWTGGKGEVEGFPYFEFPGEFHTITSRNGLKPFSLRV